jgi:hypothetical protein
MSQRSGWRGFVDDGKRVAFIVTTAITAMTAFWWIWTLSATLHPAERIVLAMAAGLIVIALALFVPWALHYYSGWPKTHPFNRSFVFAPRTEASEIHPKAIESSLSATSIARGAAARPEHPVERRGAAEDLIVSFVPSQNLSLVEVKTKNREGVSEVKIAVVSLERWSEEISPRGWCKTKECENASKPIYLSKNGGDSVLYVHSPWTFSLLGEKYGGGWTLPYTNHKGIPVTLYIPFATWKIEVQVESRGESRIETFCFADAKAQSSILVDPSTL